MIKYIEDHFPIILVIISGLVVFGFIISLIFDNFKTCVYSLNEPISTDMAKKLIDDSVKECDKNMCKFVFKIKKVNE